MAEHPRRAAFGTAVARLRAMVGGTAPDGPRGDPLERDGRSPEQRILDTAARYRDVRPVDATGRRPGADQRRGASTHPTNSAVPPPEPLDADGPIWVRRLDGRMAVMSKLPGDGLPVRTTSGPGRREPAARG
jgi:hypothetical protein